MIAANHTVPSTRWVETMVEAVKAALHHTRVAPVAPRPAASNALPSLPPIPHLQQTVKNGELPTFSQVNSQLELPATLPARMLLLSKDSGIVATMSMLRDLQARNYQGDVVLLHVCRNPAELSQASALQRAADSYPELSLLVHFDDHAGPFSAKALTLAVPDVKERTTWMCGPTGFIETVQAYWRSQRLTMPLHIGRCVTFPIQPMPPETVTA
ncbi:MAG TPA: hypothetical protein PLB25_17095 [Rhodoferax sp.]|nr:hypothetical protein [Rhodoferax sp.]